MIAKVNFEVNMLPQQDEKAEAGRFVLDKTYASEMDGSGLGQMISKRIEKGAAIYFAIEEFSGSVAGKKGTFTLAHKGFMNNESQVLEIEILEGSGTEEPSNDLWYNVH